MKEIIAKTDYRSNILIRYNEEKFDVEVADGVGLIILRRLCDNEILKAFDINEIKFIVEYDDIDNEETNFVVSYANEEKNSTYITHYKMGYETDKLNKIEKIEIVDAERIKDNSYCIYRNSRFEFYNLKERSNRFKNVYLNKEIKNILGDDIVLVKHRFTADSNCQYEDNLTYGINPVTYKIETPIWSELQQRFFEVRKYTEEELSKKRIYLRPRYLAADEDDSITLYVEAVRYLNEIARQFGDPIEAANWNDEVNEEFVRKFKK